MGNVGTALYSLGKKMSQMAGMSNCIGNEGTRQTDAGTEGSAGSADRYACVCSSPVEPILIGKIESLR